MCVRVGARVPWHACGDQRTALDDGLPPVLFEAESPFCIVAVYSMLTGLRAFRGPFVSTSHLPEGVLGLPVLPDAPIQFYMGSGYLNSGL